MIRAKRTGRSTSGKYEVATPIGVFEIRRGKRKYIRGEDGATGRHVGTWKIVKAPIDGAAGFTAESKRDLLDWIQKQTTKFPIETPEPVSVSVSRSIEDRLERIEALLSELVESKRSHNDFVARLLGAQ